MDSGMNDTLNSDYMTFITKASRHFSDEPLAARRGFHLMKKRVSFVEDSLFQRFIFLFLSGFPYLCNGIRLVNRGSSIKLFLISKRDLSY